MNNLTKQIAEAFIHWTLPESVCADRCATQQQPGRVGANLLSFVEAEQMAREVVLPLLAPAPSKETIAREAAKELHSQYSDEWLQEWKTNYTSRFTSEQITKFEKLHTDATEERSRIASVIQRAIDRNPDLDTVRLLHRARRAEQGEGMDACRKIVEIWKSDDRTETESQKLMRAGMLAHDVIMAASRALDRAGEAKGADE